MATCENCGSTHNRKRFCSNKCKDRWHNKHNLRGMYAPRDSNGEAMTMEDEMHTAGMDAVEDGWDGHKNAF